VKRLDEVEETGSAEGVAVPRALGKAIIAADQKRTDEIFTKHVERVGAQAKAIVETGYSLPIDAVPSDSVSS
jgi:hypothetical protein